MRKDTFQGVLFPEFDSENPKQWKQTISSADADKRNKILNLHLHNTFPTEGIEDMPLLSPYNGKLPDDLISYADRNKKLFHLGIHCFLYDYKIDSTWHSPSLVISCLREYNCVIAPDFTLFIDMPRAINVWNVYRNRWVSSFWQKEKINLVPSASWGNVNSFDYCFDGLPDNSIIAIGHTAIGKDKDARKLYRLGVETLIERKHPSKLIVYGAPLDFMPEVEVIYYEGIIQKLRKLCEK